MILFLFYTAAVFVLAVLPLNGKDAAINHMYVINVRLDYVIHALIFLPWMPLYALAVKKKLNGRRWKILLSGLAAGLLFAAAAEGVQFFIPYRAFNVNDLIGNGIGVTAGGIGCWIAGWLDNWIKC